MKIIQFLPNLNIGGAQIFGVDLCNELSQNNNEVCLCVLDKIKNTTFIRDQLDKKVTLISLDKDRGFSLKTIYQIYKLLREYKPDIVHTHLRGLLYASFPLMLLRIKAVHTIHNLAKKESNTIVKQKFLWLLFNYFNITPVSISHQVLYSVKKLYGDNKNVLIYNGVKPAKKTSSYENVKKQIAEYKKSADTKVLLNIGGRFTTQKNQFLLIEVIRELSNYNVVLLLIGGPTNDPISQEYYSRCKSEASKLDNIYFIEPVNNVSDYLFNADVLCISSLWEGLPLLLLEAMSVGLPIVSTPAGGIPDVLQNGKQGVISKGFTKNEYLEAIKRYLNNQEIDVKQIKQHYLNNFTMKETSALYSKLYRNKIK